MFCLVTAEMIAAIFQIYVLDDFMCNKYNLILFLTLLLFSCTHASISQIPEVMDNQEVYTYQGRSNFSHQMKVADEMLIKHCKKVNGGKAVIVSRGNQDLGYVVTGNTNTGINAMSNQNQIIKFICKI